MCCSVVVGFGSLSLSLPVEDDEDDAEALRLRDRDARGDEDGGAGSGRIKALSRPGALRRGREERVWVVARRRWVQRQW